MPVEPFAALFEIWGSGSEREFRGPGCSADACRVVQAVVPGCFGRSELLVHSAATHEAYGRSLAEGRVSAIRTGPLVVDLAAGTATVNGHEIRLSQAEWRILAYLAQRIDRVCAYAAITDAVWGAGWHDGPRPLQVTMQRLRAKVGPAACLIQTALGRGYRLAIAPDTRWET